MKSGKVHTVSRGVCIEMCEAPNLKYASRLKSTEKDFKSSVHTHDTPDTIHTRDTPTRNQRYGLRLRAKRGGLGDCVQTVSVRCEFTYIK